MIALNILIAITIILQVLAVSISLRLMRITKYNAAWILFSIAFILMLIQLVGQIIYNFKGKDIINPGLMMWVWVLTALCFTSGLFVINKLITYTARMERKRRISEERILNTIITTEEKERRRFSNDIHDGLGPLLSSVKLSISALHNMDCSQSQKEILTNAEFTIGEAIKSLRDISNNLNPHILNNFGVTRAVSSFVNKLTLPKGVKIDFTSNINGNRYEPNIEAIIYRVVCELINNAIKHSNASQILVSITKESENIVKLNIEDNGIGFDFEKMENEVSEGLGLSSIASRISSIKGKMVVDSHHGFGTKIVITLHTS
ncbi:MAG: histidine kinase [Rikenellaceae bacterium]